MVIFQQENSKQSFPAVFLHVFACVQHSFHGNSIYWDKAIMLMVGTKMA